MTSVDWDTWNASRDPSNLPTRILDKEGIDLSSPSALVMALDKNAFRRSLDHILRLVSIGFIITDISPSVLSRAMLLHGGSHVETDTELIMVGNLVEWRLSVVLGSNDKDERIRALYNAIYSYCRQAGIHELWNRYTKETLEDKTFRLKHA